MSGQEAEDLLILYLTPVSGRGRASPLRMLGERPQARAPTDGSRGGPVSEGTGGSGIDHPVVKGEQRLLIGGELREATSGKTFENVDPTTEDVLGVTADGGAQDMDLAIAAARKAFDETDWSTNSGLRSRALGQLHAALQKQRSGRRSRSPT
jgi:hypothetical protein